MTGGHYDDEELLAFDDRRDSVDIAAVTAHLAACGDCSGNLASLRSLKAMLRDPEVYELAERPRRKPDRRRIAEAQALVRRAGEEKRIAEQTFAVLTGLPLESWPAYLERHPEERTEALIDRIIVEARDHYDRRAEYSLELLGAAAAMANTLKNETAVAQQRGTIAKERANALRMLSRYREALDELDWAEQFTNHLPVRAFDLALLEWGRATVLFYMTRYAEALPLVRHASKVLQEFGDTPRVQQAALLEACVLFEIGDVAGALRINDILAQYFTETGDVHTLARVIANMAACEAALYHPDEAHRHAGRAMALYNELEMPTECGRVEWTLGDLDVRQGRIDEGRQRLYRAAEAFEALGMRSEAGQVLLDVLETHVARGEWDQALPLARTLANQFMDAGVPVHAARAYAYLREAVEAREASVDLVEYVRRYVADKTGSDFIPPA